MKEGALSLSRPVPALEDPPRPGVQGAWPCTPAMQGFVWQHEVLAVSWTGREKAPCLIFLSQASSRLGLGTDEIFPMILIKREVISGWLIPGRVKKLDALKNGFYNLEKAMLALGGISEIFSEK